MSTLVYVVGWERDQILKVGVTSRRRWRTFVNRGAVLYAITEPLVDACDVEATLRDHMLLNLRQAFSSREQAIPYLGSRGGGYLECLQAHSKTEYQSTISSLQALLQAMLRAVPNEQCTDGRTDGQDVEPPSTSDKSSRCNVREFQAGRR